jgi:hypothetical protein
MAAQSLEYIRKFRPQRRRVNLCSFASATLARLVRFSEKNPVPTKTRFPLDFYCLQAHNFAGSPRQSSGNGSVGVGIGWKHGSYSRCASPNEGRVASASTPLRHSKPRLYCSGCLPPSAFWLSSFPLSHRMMTMFSRSLFRAKSRSNVSLSTAKLTVQFILSVRTKSGPRFFRNGS